MNELATSSEPKVIEGKITSSSVVKNNAETTPEKNVQKEEMSEEYQRPEMLLGSTYKVKTPLSEHALYMTINDTVLNAGTIHEERRPFEIFINSKSMEHFQWVVGLTRVISAVWRKGGDCTFLVEELKAVFDPKGGYFAPGGKFMPSLVAEIGDVIEQHLKMIGLLEDEKLDEHQQALVDSKRKEYESLQNNGGAAAYKGDFPEHAQVCSKCMTKAVVLMDGCATCLSCGEARCG